MSENILLLGIQKWTSSRLAQGLSRMFDLPFSG